MSAPIDPTAAPVSFESPIPIENDRQVLVIVTSSLSIVVPCIFVALRFYAKATKTTKSWDLTDLAVVGALLVNIGLHIDYFLLVFKGGMGFRVADILTRFGPDVMTFFGKAIVSVGCLYNLAVWTCKIPVLLMYTTLMPVKRMIWSVRIVSVVISLSYLATTIAPLLLCRPLAFNWDKTIEGGYCGNWPAYYTACGALNIIYEGVLLVLPMPFFLNLQMALQKKLVLMAMFSVGFATCAIGIYRQTTIPGLNFDEMPFEGIGATVFSGLEPPVAISLSCVPFLRPLYRGKFGTSHDHSNYGAAGGSDALKARSMQNSRPFTELGDDGTSSEHELRPQAKSHVVTVEPVTAHGRGRANSKSGQITMQREWTVKSDYRN